jgi:hypothetical protein
MVESLSSSGSVVSGPAESNRRLSLFDDLRCSKLIRNTGNRSSNGVRSRVCTPSGLVLASNSHDDQMARSEIVGVGLENVHVDNAFLGVALVLAREIISVVLVVAALDLYSDFVRGGASNGRSNVDSDGTANSLSGDSRHNGRVLSQADVKNVGVWVVTTASTNCNNSKSEVLRSDLTVVHGIGEVNSHGWELSVIRSESIE